MKEDKIEPTLTEEVVPTVETETAPADEQPGLSLNDIASCVQIIDIVTKRGAFEGPEMAEVGAVRNRLDAFMKAAKAGEEAAAETTTE